MDDKTVVIWDLAPELQSLFSKIDGASAFANTQAAMNEVASMIHEAWVGFASGVPIPGAIRVINSRGQYKASIKVDLSKDKEKIIYSDSPIHKYLEEGTDAYDMKPGLLSGPKARFGKNGPYNVICFRHGAPDSSESSAPMPVTIYKLTKAVSKKAAASGTTSKSMQVVSTNNMTGIRSKRVASFMPGRNNYTWKVGPYAGMMKIDTTTGAAKRSSYLTFRVVSTKSDPSSWIRPPQPGLPIRQAALDAVHDIAIELLKEAVRKDMQGE